MSRADDILLKWYAAKMEKHNVKVAIDRGSKKLKECQQAPKCPETDLPQDRWCERCQKVAQANELLYQLKKEVNTLKRAVRLEARRLYKESKK